ncbi:DUF2911 domain-containing protein [Olivibacter sp. SDN3]|uniref:DUF2911 domain-containing protein n=1 Tax=Olivibacter sp. SDN3 TaxID=2764720 RepID=UPI0016514E0B|nr:DUF2911 domain-containing protein [Olivibacter sp. SDN3]QNL51123.1 DUF2911 domain-containing protein [Olivibacter sp. SDN3]
MKKMLLFLVFLCVSAVGVQAQQDKSKRPSPPDSVKVTTGSGLDVEIHYSRPSVKGRALGVDIAPLGTVWRTGANEATTFAISKDATIDGKSLKAGKYSLYSIPGENTSTIIFNKIWDQWGTNYDEKEDELRVDVPTEESTDFKEQFTITASETGLIELHWGNYKMFFTVK